MDKKKSKNKPTIPSATEEAKDLASPEKEEVIPKKQRELKRIDNNKVIFLTLLSNFLQ